MNDTYHIFDPSIFIYLHYKKTETFKKDSEYYQLIGLCFDITFVGAFDNIGRDLSWFIFCCSHAKKKF